LVEMKFLANDGQIHTMQISTDKYTPSPLSPLDQKIAAQHRWVSTALDHYYRWYDDIPESIGDLQQAGLWPFTGSEINYITGEPLQFDSKAPGNIMISFASGKVLTRVVFSNNTVMFSGIPPTIAN